MKPTQFHELHTELAEALYQSAGCTIDFCTSQICCISMCRLMDRVGLAYNLEPNHFSSNYVHAYPDYSTSEEASVLGVIGILVRTGNICAKDIWEGFSEIPMSIGELLSENDGFWSSRIRDLKYEQMSNAAMVLTGKEFLYVLTRLAFSDKYFELMQQKG
jgi:hypothetical protein